MDTARGQASKKHFQVAERRDVTTTDPSDEVDVAVCVCSLPAMQSHTFYQAAVGAFDVEEVHSRRLSQPILGTCVKQATDAFLAEAESGVRPYEPGVMNEDVGICVQGPVRRCRAGA